MVRRVIGEYRIKQIQNPAEHQTKGELKQVSPLTPLSPDHKLCRNKETVYRQGRISQADAPDLRRTE